jgi:hypothetical protein
MCASRPEDRFGSAAEVLTALREAERPEASLAELEARFPPTVDLSTGEMVQALRTPPSFARRLFGALLVLGALGGGIYWAREAGLLSLEPGITVEPLPPLAPPFDAVEPPPLVPPASDPARSPSRPPSEERAVSRGRAPEPERTRRIRPRRQAGPKSTRGRARRPAEGRRPADGRRPREASSVDGRAFAELYRAVGERLHARIEDEGAARVEPLRERYFAIDFSAALHDAERRGRAREALEAIANALEAQRGRAPRTSSRSPTATP